jgi:hypothetical protein
VSSPLRKCLSLTHAYTAEGGANDWRFHDNSTEAIESQTRWIKVWINWDVCQGSFPRPQTAVESWDQLNANPWSVLQRLDSIIASINADGAALEAAGRGNLAVLLSVDAATPVWARVPGQEATARSVPDAVQGDSPWAWFIAHLCARYRQGAPIATPGPVLSGGPQAALGNTAGGWITALEICNEPNNRYLGDDAFIIDTTAQMIRTGEAMAAFWGAPSMLLAPGMTDEAGFEAFSSAVLQQLQDFVPRLYVGWSLHDYGDCEHAVAGSDPALTHAAIMQDVLTANGWKGGTDRAVWLTEGGARTEPRGMTEAEARDRVVACYGLMEQLPDVPLFCNHMIVDPPTASGTFFTGLKHADGSPKALRDAWFALPAAAAALPVGP